VEEVVEEIMGHGGHGHHGGGGGGGRFRGTPWAGWGAWGDPYAYDMDYDLVEPIIVPVILNTQDTTTPQQANVVTTGQDVTVLGMIDIQAWQAQMNTIKQVPVSVARVLLKSGQDAIQRAMNVAKSKSLPGDTARETCFWKLVWHEEALAKLPDPNAMYSSGDDLKKWVLAAYVEANAAEEGALWIAQAWSQMWNEIGVALAKLPKQIAAQVNQTVGSLLGMPVWLMVLLGLTVVGGGVLVYAKAKGSR
jgi:hypothetical protein